MKDSELIKRITKLKIENKDFGIATNTVKQSLAYVYILTPKGITEELLEAIKRAKGD